MSIDYQTLRIDGIYQQNDAGDLMLRVKIPAGILSAVQAETIAEVAEAYASDTLHLTTRGSIELHQLRYENLDAIARRLAAVGLTSRGACGGAVRGIACSTPGGVGFGPAQVLAARLHRHFTGNPHFEGLPKKFKIAVESSYHGARHLIQDLALVYLGTEGERRLYDVWVAGGLGREPQAAFLLAGRVAEGRLLPLIEGVVKVYMEHVEKGRRLKHLLRNIGEARFRDLLAAATAGAPAPFPDAALDRRLTPAAANDQAAPEEAVVFAGELAAATLRQLAAIARAHSDGFLVVTADQNLALFPAGEERRQPLRTALAEAGFDGRTPEQQIAFRVCPGSHECKMGLAPVRDVTRQIIAALPEKVRGLSFAISGCPNSCSQPQLAAVGISTVKLVRQHDGSRTPLFALWRRREAEGLGVLEEENLTQEQLLQSLSALAL